jgi:hypothetical protein
MAKNRFTFFTSGARPKGTSFLAADGINSKDLFIPAVDDSRIEIISIISTSVSQLVLFLQINDVAAGQFYPLGHVTIPPGVGTGGSAASVSGLNRGNFPWVQIDANGNPYLNLSNNFRLSGRLMTALTGSEQISVTVFGADYTEVPTS